MWERVALSQDKRRVGPVEENVCQLHVCVHWEVPVQGTVLGKTLQQLRKLDRSMQFDPFLSIYSQRNESFCSYKTPRMNICSSCICNWPKLYITKMFFSE